MDIDTENTSARPVFSSSTSNPESNQTNSHFIIAECRRNTDVSTNQNITNNQETSEESDAEEKLLAVYCRGGKLGAAYHTIQTGELFILDEIVDRPPEYQMFLNLFRQVDPSRILLEGKAQGSFVQTVKKTVFGNSDDEATCKLIFISSREYTCKRRIHSLSLPYEPNNCSEEERSLFLRTVVDFSQTQSVHALGALLRYLDLNWSAIIMDLHSKPEYMSLKKISLADILTIDEDTYRGLQIFSPVSHPSGFKRGARGTSREGLSLYQMFKRCSSRIGQARMRVLMQHPTTDIEILTRRQEVVAFFMRPQSDVVSRNICSSLRYIRNVNMALYMNRIIDFDLTKSEGKFTVKAGVDPELDRKKQTMASLHGLMSETAKIELERLPEFVEECTMLYMPHLGYLLGVRAWPNMVPGQKELPGMKFMATEVLDVHNITTVPELDVMIGDAYPEIVAHETRIMMRLTTIVLQNLNTLAGLVDKCTELDCLIAISKVSKEFGFIQPTLVSDKVLSIKQGRHPLAAATCEAFVPNDTDSSLETGFVKILTGPNSSGKSVYMKQIAHIGSFVPAERATIGVVSHIYTRIHSTECVAAHMSAFLIDLRQMALALQESTSNSLIIIDEFGKGTSEVDGLSLLAACLNTFLYQGEQCPHLFVSTHFLEIQKFIINTPIAKFLRFEHTLQDGEPVFLFRLVEGIAESSFAHQVAEASGITPNVVQRAQQVFDCVKNNKLPPENKKITTKLQSFIEIIKNELLSEDI
ncbi:unnamed protein product [Diatraea saccharalis]|uniref:DNA mismatch repair proteins mutS family domain-containing protein n=1 Tax=Diatraea saccharalis TaxID=40085 RepID=A0A9N9RHL0_9NEOP|nr:unnamed protein product [Diatraea saccharalis]